MAFDRNKLDNLLKRRFFYDQSFSIYGGISGLYDYGPMGCAIETNIIQAWRSHFILNEAMLEVKCSALTPEAVLKSSGHVERFIDWMVKDVKTGECFRADHLIKSQAEAHLQDVKAKPELRQEMERVLQQLEGYSNADMEEVIRRYNFKSPTTKNELSAPVSFNLMFPTQIGPVSDARAFLRPETAQGIFVNFNRLLEFNQGKLPFAAAQIGTGFRNEISPRQGLLRVRDFTMAEIEHFVDPSDKQHPKFKRVADLKLTLFPACNQVDGGEPMEMLIGEAVAQGIVDNETLGYYMARTHLFLVSVGVDPKRLRFRQHMANEMAHYAKDCWDAECHCSYGWIECVGCADRACYDLTQHTKTTGVKLAAERRLEEPKTVHHVEAVPKKALIGKQYKSDASKIMARLATMSLEEVEDLEKQLGKVSINVDGQAFELERDWVEVKRHVQSIHTEEVHPSVIEPSFGIGRIMYVVLEHAFRQREGGDEARNYLEMIPSIAPIKCCVLPLSGDKRFDPILDAVRTNLISRGMSQKTDTSGNSIGRRYARNDEIGIPFGITVDFASLEEPWTVTLRHTASLEQVRLKAAEVGETIEELVKGRMHWTDMTKKFPVFKREEEEEEN